MLTLFQPAGARLTGSQEFKCSRKLWITLSSIILPRPRRLIKIIWAPVNAPKYGIAGKVASVRLPHPFLWQGGLTERRVEKWLPVVSWPNEPRPVFRWLGAFRSDNRIKTLPMISIRNAWKINPKQRGLWVIVCEGKAECAMKGCYIDYRIWVIMCADTWLVNRLCWGIQLGNLIQFDS